MKYKKLYEYSMSTTVNKIRQNLINDFVINVVRNNALTKKNLDEIVKFFEDLV